MCETRNIHRMSMGKSLVNYPSRTLRLRFGVIRGGWKWFRIILRDGVRELPIKRSVFFDLRGQKEEDVALIWMVLSYSWRCCVWVHRI